MKSTIKIYGVILSVILFSLTNSCARKDAMTERKVITWAFWGSPEAMVIYDNIVQRFEEEYPQIKVNLMNIAPSVYGTKLSTMIAGGTAPDIFWVGGDNIADYAVRGAVKELDSLVERDAKKIEIEDFYEATLEAGRVKGKLYGIPKGINPIIIAYNKDIFDEAGVKYPREDWTWDDFLLTAKELTMDKDGDGRIDQFGFCSLGKEFWQWMPFVLQNGGSIFNEAGTKSNFDLPQTVESLEFYVDLVHKHHVSPSVAQSADLDYYSQFTNKRVAMTLGSHPFVLVFNRHKGLNWDIAPLPKNKNKSTVLTLGFFVISAHTKNLEESWKFVSYITGQKSASEYFSKLGEEMPPRKSMSHIQDNPTVPPEHHEVFFTEMEYAHALPPITRWQEIYDIMMSELESAILGQKDVKGACLTVKKKVDELLNYIE